MIFNNLNLSQKIPHPHLPPLSPRKKRGLLGLLMTVILLGGLAIGATLVKETSNIQQRAASVSGIKAITQIKDRISQDLMDSLSDDDRIRAGEYFSTMKQDGSWEGINMKAADGLGVYQHMTRVLDIAKVYKERNDPAWLARIELSTSFANKELVDLLGSSRPGWSWYLDIGVTDYGYGQLLILLDKKINTKLYNETALLVERLTDFNSDVDNWANQKSGANKVWRAMAKFYSGLISNNDAKLLTAKNWMERGLTPNPYPLNTNGKPNQDYLNGIMPDYSYLFHNGVLQTGSYGTNDPYFASAYNFFTNGTVYQLETAPLQTQFNFLTNGLEWIYFKGNKDVLSLGRETNRLSRTTYQDNQRETAILTLAYFYQTTMDANNKAWLAGIIKGQLTHFSPSEYLKLGHQKLLQEIKNSSYPEVFVSGHKYYPFANYTIHRGRDYYLSLKNVSDRNMAFESTNGEGLKNWFYSDGAMYLTFTGKEFINDKNILPTYDWTRISGVTLEQKNRLPDEGSYHFGERSFVGGVTFESSGVSAMDFKAYNSCLTAKKSWFFFDNEIVALGSNINCNSSNPIETVVNQWPILDNPATQLTVNGLPKSTNLGWSEDINQVKWMQHNNIGYYFPFPTSIRAWRTNQSGSWKDLGNSTALASQVYTNPFLKFVINHGVKPNNASYTYVLLPNKSAQETEAYASSNQLEIISNDASAHAVYHKSQNVLGVIFWDTKKKIRGISVDKPVILFVKYGTGGKVALVVSNPTGVPSNTKFNFDGKYSSINLPPGATLKTDTVITNNGVNKLTRKDLTTVTVPLTGSSFSSVVEIKEQK